MNRGAVRLGGGGGGADEIDVERFEAHGRAVAKLRKLGFARCRLTVAVPNDSPYRAAEDLAGLRVATSHMNLTRRFFESREIPVDVIPVSGAAEVAPRLGLAEAIVDLVSTGSTMVVNGLRPIEEVFASEAVRGFFQRETNLEHLFDVLDIPAFGPGSKG